MFFCKNCLQPSHRPRIQFSRRGWCNACEWHEQKMTTVDWKAQYGELGSLCDRFRRKDGWWDALVPCSGGKDGSYVSWKLKHDFGMNVLGVSCPPLIPTRIGEENLRNYKYSGFQHMSMPIDLEALRIASKKGFVDQGRPWHAFDTMISTSIIQFALRLDIPLIVYGEEGEREYGGATDARQKIDRKYLLDYYYCGHDPSQYGLMWKLPKQKDLDKLYLTHWSKFEDWDPQVHARSAKEHCGLEMLVGGSIGTFTNYASLDDLTRDLHVFLQFTKFGFGRCIQDANVEVRRGRMSRAQAVEVSKKIDGVFPMEVLPSYLDYYEMKETEFWEVIDRWVDYDILYKTGKPEKPYELKDEYSNYNVFMPDDCDGVNFERGKFSSV